MGANLANGEQKQQHMARDPVTPASEQLAELRVLFVGAQTADRGGGAPCFTEAQSKIEWSEVERLGVKWGESACIRMKCINLVIYLLAVSCGVGQGFFSSPLSWTLPVTEWRSSVCGLLLSYHGFDDKFTELMCNSWWLEAVRVL